MKRLLILCLFCIPALIIRGEAPAPAMVQGLYEGIWNGDKIEVRVVAEDDGAYRFLLRPEDGGKGARVELAGKTDGDTVHFDGTADGVKWSGSYAAGVISGVAGQNWEFHRIERTSPTLGRMPPEGATVFLDGKSLTQLKHTGGGSLTDAAYRPDGSFSVPKHGIDSMDVYGPNFEYDLHAEFLCPLAPKSHGWSRGSGGWLFLPNGARISVLDSFGEPSNFKLLPAAEQARMLQKDPAAASTFQGGLCGGLFPLKNPDAVDVIDSLKADKPGDNSYSLASAPPLQWQTFDIQYRLSSTGGNPRVTIFQNGIKIHDQAQLDTPARKGVLHLRPTVVLWRNLWLVPVKNGAEAPLEATDAGVTPAPSSTSPMEKPTPDTTPPASAAPVASNAPTETPAAKTDSPGMKAFHELVKSLNSPEGLDITKNVEIGKPDGVPVTVDLAVKKDRPSTPLPVVLCIHGGGWKNGSSQGALQLYYAQHGYFVASVNYRLSGVAKWPAQIQDCKLAVRWLRAHADQYKIDPDKIGVWGFSAGGHLVACIGTMEDVPAFEGDGGYANFSSKVQAVIDFSGPADMTYYFDRRGGAAKAADYKNELFGEGWKDHPEILLNASPVHFVKPGLPPFFIGAGDKDQAVPHEQTDALTADLQKAGVPVTYLVVKNAGHGLSPLRDFDLNGLGAPDPTYDVIMKQTLDFLDKYLKSNKSGP